MSPRKAHQKRVDSSDAQNSDTENDWTLVSPPGSANNSPTRQQESHNDHVDRADPGSLGQIDYPECLAACGPSVGETAELAKSNSRHEHNELDNSLVEVNLKSNNDDSHHRTKPAKRSVRFLSSLKDLIEEDANNQQSNATEPKLSQPQDSTSAAKTEEGVANQSTSEEEAPLVADVEKAGLSSIEEPQRRCENSEASASRVLDRILDKHSRTQKVDELEKAFEGVREDLVKEMQDERERQEKNLIYYFYIPFFVIVSSLFLIEQLGKIYKPLEPAEQFLTGSDKNRLIDIDFSQHVYPDLLLLHEELESCISKYSDDFVRDSHNLRPNSSENRPYKGIACYEQEMEWRRKLADLRSKHNIDLFKLLKQAKRRLTSQQLESHDPKLKFSLIVNQVEYLEYLDQKRRDRSLERLKAENLDLANRLKRKHAESSKRKHARDQNQLDASSTPTGVESELIKLRGENDLLKARLAEKAGTIYIKQSIELERCEKDNMALKRFHNQVAQEVSRGLKQLNLHTIDTVAISDDRESLESQLAVTRGYLLRLSEEVGNLANKNRVLMDEIKASHLATQDLEQQPNETVSSKRALTANGYSLRSLEAGSNLEANSPTPRRFIEYNRSDESSESNQNFKSDWLMKRAKLRERLRRAGVDILNKNLDHTTGAKSKHNEPDGSKKFCNFDKKAYEPHNSKLKQPHKRKSCWFF